MKKNELNKKIAVMGFNAGLSSTTLLLNLLANNYEIYPVYINYGQLSSEMRIEFINNNLKIVNKYFNQKMKLHIININGLENLFDVGELNPDKDLITGFESVNKIEEIYYPNKMSLIYNLLKGYSLHLSSKTTRRIQLALGIHKQDKDIYPDSTITYRKKEYMSFREGSKNGDRVDFYTPFMICTKNEIIDRGIKYCVQLGLDFNEIYKNTTSCYKPLFNQKSWISDYKSPSSINRIKSFMDMNIKDPCVYGDETSIVDWTNAKSYTLEVLYDLKHIKTINTQNGGNYERLTQEQVLDLAYETGDLHLYSPALRVYVPANNITSVKLTSNGKRFSISGTDNEGNSLMLQIGKTYFTNFLDVELNNNLSEKINDLYNLEVEEVKKIKNK